jgi:predicted kinase
MPELIILRGLPGSGKSTLANILSDPTNSVVLSIDDFFTNAQTGEYVFNYFENHLAYKHCEERVKEHMNKNTQRIFLDNCFTMEWEMEPYFKLAAQFKYTVFVLTVENRHGGKNIHHISQNQLVKMAEKYKVVLM